VTAGLLSTLLAYKLSIHEEHLIQR